MQENFHFLEKVFSSHFRSQQEHKRFIDEYYSDLSRWTMAENKPLNTTSKTKKSVSVTMGSLSLKAPENTKFATYASTVLVPLAEYMLGGFVVRKIQNVTFNHGGTYCVDSEKNALASLASKISLDERAAFADGVSFRDIVKSAPSKNLLHRMAFTFCNPIVGRVKLGARPVLTSDDSLLTVVGHTPQTAGIPTIFRTDGRCLIQLDTQFTSREKNTHCLAVDAKSGKFLLRGSLFVAEEVAPISYEANSHDPLVGSHDPSKSPPVFTVAKVTSPKRHRGKYVEVQYVELEGYTFPFPKVSLVEKEGAPGDESTSDNFDFTHVLCGDIESSVPFLRGFLRHACNILDLDCQDESLENMSRKIVQQVSIVTIGDIVGDPAPPGEIRGSEPATVEEEAMVVAWANKFSDVKILGNREWNKLRLFHEIPQVLTHMDPKKYLEGDDAERKRLMARYIYTKDEATGRLEPPAFQKFSVTGDVVPWNELEVV